jgi:hypothetical protein
VLLQQRPQLSGILIDQPEVSARAGQVFAEANVGSRTGSMGGDFFAGIPGDGHVYLLKCVLHNWDDTSAERLLASCRRSMPMHARLLVAERVLPDDDTPSEAKLFDINMLVVAGGKERTQAECRRLLEKTGFGAFRIIPTESPLSLIEAQPAVP